MGRMKSRFITAAVGALLFLTALSAQAQQQAASAPELRKQIQELVVIDRSDSAPEEVKTVNRKFLKERRTQLGLLLERRVSALQKYLESTRAILGPSEKKEVQETIRDLEKEIRDLSAEDSIDPGSAETATTGTTPIRRPSGNTVASSAAGTDSVSAIDPATVVRADAERSPALFSTQATAGSQKSPGGQAEQALRQEVEVEKANIIDEVAREVRSKRGDARTSAAQVFGPTQDPAAYAKVLSLALTMNALPREQFNSEIESARVDKQVGGPSSNAGSTSLVSKGSIPAILGFAVENGGLTRTNEGTTITFRGNLVGLADALGGKGFIDSFEDDSLTIRRLRKLSFALSYDTSLGSTPSQFTGNRQQLSSYSFRYEFVNHRDPRDPRYAAKWASLVRDNAQAVARDANRVQNLFLRDSSLRAWLEDARTAIASATDDSLESVVRAQFDNLERINLSLPVRNAVNNFTTAFSDYRQKREALLNIVANGPIFTVDYTNNRRPGLIDTSNLNLIYSTGVAEGRASFTFNGAATLFNSSPGAGMSRFRDFDFSTQLDIPFGDPRGFGQFDLSFAGQYKRLVEDEMMSNGTTMKTKGDIGTLNLKLEVPIRNLGIKFPLALTYSNRTEFDLRKQLRANFGFAFDPDTLYNLLKPFSK
jgi:hypothetical protein